MLPLVTFADPERLVIDACETAWTGRLEPYKPTSVETGFPTDTSTYHVQIDLENTPGDDYPARERNQVRITCWAPPKKRTDVKALASVTQGLLNMHPRIRPIGGRSRPVTDPDTKAEMCWFLVRVNNPGIQH
jgi:hypothetical protein